MQLKLLVSYIDSSGQLVNQPHYTEARPRWISSVTDRLTLKGTAVLLDTGRGFV